MSVFSTTLARTTGPVSHARDLCRELPLLFAASASLTATWRPPVRQTDVVWAFLQSCGKERLLCGLTR